MATTAARAPARISPGWTNETPAARAWRRLRRRKSAMLGLVIIVLLVSLALLAPLISPYDPAKQSWTLVRKPPSWAHWLGTDESGRDLLSRTIWGARASLMPRFRLHVAA